MSRQWRKLQAAQSQPEEIELSEEEPVSNKFLDFEDLEEEQDSPEALEEEKSPREHTHSTTQGKVPETEETFEELLETLKNVQVPQFEETRRKTSSLKRVLKHFDRNSEIRKSLREDSQQNRAHKTATRLCLTPEKAGWNMPINYLITMNKVPDPLSAVFFFDSSKNYNKLAPEYIEAVEGNDPNALMDFLAKYPFHIEALYQVCMLFRMQGNHEQAGEFLDRLLFSFQRSFHHLFSPLGSNLLCIEFNQFNRTFYRCLFMKADSLGRKGCPRTALEISKFLLSLSPQDDPQGALFLIDYYSLRAREYEYFMAFADNFMNEYWGYGDILPHHLYSYALCKMICNLEGKHSEVTSAEDLDCASPDVLLKIAVQLAPGIAKALLGEIAPGQELEVPQRPCVYGDLEKVSQIYATRNAEFWKSESVSSWLKRCVKESSEVDYEFLLDRRLEGFYDKYRSLDAGDFSSDVRTVIPQDLNIGRPPRAEGNLDIDSNPFYLFFASLLPWNSLNLPED